MNVTNDGFKDRQLHIEDYLQTVSAEQKEYAEVSAHQRIAENNDIKLRNRLGTEPYARWCGRSVDKIIIYLLPDYRKLRPIK